MVESAAIVGESAPEADVVVTPWPSDHRAVAATVELLSGLPYGRPGRGQKTQVAPLISTEERSV